MKALWLEDGTQSLRDDVPVPDALSTGEALVRVRLSGICGADLELVRGYYPYAGVLGHEFVGDVVAAPLLTVASQQPELDGMSQPGTPQLGAERGGVAEQRE